MLQSINASQVFALLNRNYRVSRNTRAIWQFQQIAPDSAGSIRIPTAEEIKQSTDEIVLVSALDNNGNPIPPSSNIICTNSTRFSYYTMRYKFAFILDMTDSCASVSIDGGHIYLESLTNCLCKLLYSLSQTLTLPGCELKFQPEIDISVYVYFPLQRTPSHQVLIHGYRLTCSTLESVCRLITTNLKEATNLLQNVMKIGQPFNTRSTVSTMDSDDNINLHLNAIRAASESSCAIINMLSYGITALQLMPEESTAGLVIITDGILDVPNLSAFETVMRQIRARIISCSFVQIGSNNCRPSTCTIEKHLTLPTASLGHVPNEELLKFISSSTFGSFLYFDLESMDCKSTSVKDSSILKLDPFNVGKRSNEFQNELLSWGFHKAIGEESVLPLKQACNGSYINNNKNNRNKKKANISLPISCKLVNQTVLQTSLENVLSLRLREGYTVRNVQIQKDEIEVHLVLPWHYDIQIYYTARSVWPLENSMRTEIRVYKEAPTCFLQEINLISHGQIPKSMNSNRYNVMQRYNDVIQTVSVADRHLTLLNTFTRNKSYYQPPELAKRSRTIFTLTSKDLQPLLTVKDSECQVFANFWRPILILDGSLWQRFMYTHNLTVILVNDPLTNGLLSMNVNLSQSFNQPHSSISFNTAKCDFESFLSEYFSCILLGGQAYIKFLMRGDPPVPYSFLLLRVMGQQPLFYLKFAFQAKATTMERHKMMEDFRSSLARYRPRPRMKSGNLSENNRRLQTSTPVSSVSSQRSLPGSAIGVSQRLASPFCIILNKNIERLILKPDPFPYESLGIQKPDEEDVKHKTQTELDSKRQALSKFFYIRSFIRSFESIKHASNIPKRIADIILDTLIRRRLQEGFHFIDTPNNNNNNNNNIYNLFLEVTMSEPKEEYSEDKFRLNPNINLYPDDRVRTCLIQYRIYPVECGRSVDTSSSNDLRSSSTRRSSSIYCDQPTCYYFLTQCWVEPQDGFVDTKCPELEFLNQCTYQQIVDKIGEVDRECFNTLVSFYFVKYLQEKSLSLPKPILRAPRAITSDIYRVPFIQDTLSLIRRSHQSQFDFWAFRDNYSKIREDYIHNGGFLATPSHNSTLLSVLRERLCSRTYESRPQLFSETTRNHNAFTRSLIERSSESRHDALPLGLRSIKSEPYLLYLLNHDAQQQQNKPLTDLERYLVDMLFPRWEFLVYADNVELIHMVLLPKSERDLLLLNIDLHALMKELTEYYSRNQADSRLPVSSDYCEAKNDLSCDAKSLVDDGNSDRITTMEKPPNKSTEEHTVRHSRGRRQRRETVTSGDLLIAFSKSAAPSSSTATLVHSSSGHLHALSSQSVSSSYRRIHSPLTIDTHHISPGDHSHRRYSASAAVSPAVDHSNLQNVSGPGHRFLTQHKILGQNTEKKSDVPRWRIPIYLYTCNKLQISSSLISTNEHQLKTQYPDSYYDCSKDVNDSSNGTLIATVSVSESSRSRRHGENTRRHEEETMISPDKIIEEMYTSWEYAFATAFYKNCLLELTVHEYDIDDAVMLTYRDHFEDINFTPFLKAMCKHMPCSEHKTDDFENVCEPTTKHIHSYLQERFLSIVNKYFRRASPDAVYFYYCSEEDRLQHGRDSVEIEDRISSKNSHNNNSHNGNDLPSTYGPYKFDDSNGYEEEEMESEDDGDSTDTVHIRDHNDDDDDTELQLATGRRRSDASISSMSNRSRDLSVRGEVFPLLIAFDFQFDLKGCPKNELCTTIPCCLIKFSQPDSPITPDSAVSTVSFSLVCLAFPREDGDSQNVTTSGLSTNTSVCNHSLPLAKRFQDISVVDSIETTSICTNTTGAIESNKHHPLDKFRLTDAQRRAILSCRQEIEWLIRDEELATYFSYRTINENLIASVIAHVQSSVNIEKSNCLCRSIDLMFVLGYEKSLEPFYASLNDICIRNKYKLMKCGDYFVLNEPIDRDPASVKPKRKPAISVSLSDDQSSAAMNESSVSESSFADYEDDIKSSEDELDGCSKPPFWLFVEKKQNVVDKVDVLETKFYLYCGSSSDTAQNSSESKEILQELIKEVNRACRTVNQKLLLDDLVITRLCNPLLVPAGENDDSSSEPGSAVLAANLIIPPGTFACDELWRHSFPLHSRLRPYLHMPSSNKASAYHPGSLIRELTTHFCAFVVHNRKNLFFYHQKGGLYYIRFREDTLPPTTPCPMDDSLLLSDSNTTFNIPRLSSQTTNENNSSSCNPMKIRQRHDSGTFCIHVMIYGLESTGNTETFEEVRNNLFHSVATRLEDEVVKELVNALYHYAMTRLNPDDVTFMRPVDSEPKYIFEYKISSSINTNIFLYYFRRYVKTNQYHQPLLLPILAKDVKEIIKDYHGQTLIVYNRNYNMSIPRPSLAWIELHVLSTNNRTGSLPLEDLSEDPTIQSFIDLISVTERKPDSSLSTTDNNHSSENILRCHVWTRGSQLERESVTMSNTLLEAFTFALSDYVTEYKLLPTLCINPKHEPFEQSSPRLVETPKLTNDSAFLLDRSAQTYTPTNTMPSTFSVQSRRHSTNSPSGTFNVFTKLNKSVGMYSPVKFQRQESMQNSLLSQSSIEDPQPLTIKQANRLTSWFYHLSKTYPKLPSVTFSSYTLPNRILIVDIIQNFTSWLNEQRIIAYKHESLHGTTFQCDKEKGLYVPLPSLDQLSTRIPGERLEFLILYQTTRMICDATIESTESLPQQESGDILASANSSDIPKQLFLCVVVNDKTLTMILYNAPDELCKLLTGHFTNLINWSIKRLNVLDIIVTQKMGLFRYRPYHAEHHTDYNRHNSPHGMSNKHLAKSDHVDLEQLVKEAVPPKTKNTYTPWNIDLLYCNLVGSYPQLSNDANQDLIQRHGMQLLQLRENKKIHVDRCTKLEEICSNWVLRPKLSISDELLTQMKHHSRLLSVAVVPILFSRLARQFFQNNATLRTTNTVSLDAFIPAVTTATPAEVLPINQLPNKRKSIANPVDFSFLRFKASADENDYQLVQTPVTRFDVARLINIEQTYVKLITTFIKELAEYLEKHYKFHPTATKSHARKILRSTYAPSPIEYNFHRSDQSRCSTLLAELSSLNNVQIVVRMFQYDIVKMATNNQSLVANHFRQMSNDSIWIPDQTELDAFVYDFHLQKVISYYSNSNDTQIFSSDFSLITFLHDFIEYYPTAPAGSKTALFKTIIRHQLDGAKRSSDLHLFKYILDHPDLYGIQVSKRNNDEYIYDYNGKDICWMAAKSTAATQSELTVTMFIIYVNLSPKQLNTSNTSVPSLNKIPIPSASHHRIANSLKINPNNTHMRERASTILSSTVKPNLIIPVRSSSFAAEQTISNNIPMERNVEYFKALLSSIINKASLSYRRESLWEKMIASRIDPSSASRQESSQININELQALMDSCIGDETKDLTTISLLLERVFMNKEQTDRLYRYLRLRYGSQFHILNSPTNNFLVIFQYRAPQQCDAFLVINYRSDQDVPRCSIVKHRHDVDCDPFIRTFKRRITYFLWECLV